MKDGKDEAAGKLQFVGPDWGHEREVLDQILDQEIELAVQRQLQTAMMSFIPGLPTYRGVKTPRTLCPCALTTGASSDITSTGRWLARLRPS